MACHEERKKMKHLFIALIIGLVGNLHAAEDAVKLPDNRDGRCDHCGSCQRIRRVPVPKPATIEKTKVCWDVKHEDVILPGPSCLCGRHHGRDDCGCFWYQLWKPTCAKVISKTVPVKREMVREVPGFEWTVEERCCYCR